MLRLGDAIEAQRITVQIRIIGHHVQGCGRIFGQDGRVIDSNRIVVFRIDGQAHRRRVGAAGAVRDRIGEAVGAVIIGFRRVGHGAVEIDRDGAMLRLGDAVEA